jgi:hypothetical protein
MTVADLLAAAAADTLGDPLAIRQQGSGASAFLTQINDAPNEGADGRNWTYQVNGQHADRPFAAYELQPGDAVLWRYGKAQ